MAASQESVRPSFRLRAAASELDTVGHRRFSMALMRQGLGGILADRPVALILMGDWRVPAGTIAKSMKTAARTTAVTADIGEIRRSAQEEKNRQRAFFRLTARGLTG
ncbi:MAG TPA: hypothetical protein VLM89_02470 [Phycisphaerae bacterium]|nr:hypothetical protein [Phycisphaerae bacterium]